MTIQIIVVHPAICLLSHQLTATYACIYPLLIQEGWPWAGVVGCFGPPDAWVRIVVTCQSATATISR